MICVVSVVSVVFGCIQFSMYGKPRKQIDYVSYCLLGLLLPCKKIFSSKKGFVTYILKETLNSSIPLGIKVC